MPTNMLALSTKDHGHLAFLLGSEADQSSEGQQTKSIDKIRQHIDWRSLGNYVGPQGFFLSRWALYSPATPRRRPGLLQTSAEDSIL